MATQGPLFPGTTATLANAGTSENAEAWVNPGNIVSDNATEAQITAATYDSPDISQLLVASNFGFTLPSGATVNGITVEVDRRSIIASSGKDFRVQLATGTAFANLVGTNKAVPATIWPTSSTIATYGGAADTWTAGLTQAQVNAVGFAVMLSCQANIANADVGVDFIRVTITYTAPETHSGTVTGTGGGVGTISASKAALRAITATAGGIATVSQTTSRSRTETATAGGIATVSQTSARAATVSATGGGVATITYQVAETHSGSLVATGGGIAVLQATTNRDIAVTATGAGVATLTQTTDRSTSASATGGGVGTVTYAAERSGTISVTGGGVASLSVTSARFLASLLSGGGVMTELHSTERFATITVTGGGTAVVSGGNAGETHDGTVSATGGGEALLVITTGRSVTVMGTAAGTATVSFTGAHSGSVTVTGGGRATLIGGGIPFEPLPLPAKPDVSVAVAYEAVGLSIAALGPIAVEVES